MIGIMTLVTFKSEVKSEGRTEVFNKKKPQVLMVAVKQAF